MRDQQAMVYVVDDDTSVRNALARLLRVAGFTVLTFSNADEFLAARRPAKHACLIADIRMRGMSGLELQQELRRIGSILHVIFVTAQDLDRSQIEAIQASGAACLIKPVDEQALLDAVDKAIAMSDQQTEM
jgi:FixJ family two-component response regulator